MSARILSGRDTASGNFVEIEVEAGLIRNVRISENDRQSAIDSWLSPGFVDLQVNGYRGFDLNAADVEPEVVIGLTRELLAVGVTTFLPTIITASKEQIIASLRSIARARQMDAAVAESIPFAHLEGPHIHAEDGARGAHPLEHVRAPDLAEFDRWQADSGCAIGLVTLSPHWPGAPEYIAGLKARSVRVAIGHTHATSEEISTAVAAGATLSTHLGNGIASMLPRHPNPLWTQLADDRLWASLIADGHHLPAETLKVILRAKGIERCILVSDAVALAGLPTGIYQTPIGGKVEVRADGRLNMAGTNMLAGSGSSIKDDIAYMVRSGLTSLGDAVRMATINPARFLGRSAELTVGAQANIVQFCMDEVSRKIEIQSVIAGKGASMRNESKLSRRTISRRSFLELSAVGAVAMASRHSRGETNPASASILPRAEDLNDTHDLISLPAWGPYSKKYFGISHIPDVAQGLNFDFSLFPMLEGEPAQLPNVTDRCGVAPWEASPKLDFYSFRMALLPTNQLYCELSFQELDSGSRLIRIEFVNHTSERHKVALHSLAQMCFPPLHELTAQPVRLCDVLLPPKAIWVYALDYKDMQFAKARPTDNLVTEGRWRGEERSHDTVGGSVLAQNFGRSAGDFVTYEVALVEPFNDACLLFRFKMPSGKSLTFDLGGITQRQIVFTGEDTFSTMQLPVGRLAAGHHTIRLTSQGGDGIALNGFAVAEAGANASVRFSAKTWQQKPLLVEDAPTNGVHLKYDDTASWYGYSLGIPAEASVMLPWRDVDGVFGAHSGQDTLDRIFGRADGRPGDPDSLFVHTSWPAVMLAPSSRHVSYGILAAGSKETTHNALARFDAASSRNERVHIAAKRKSFEPPTHPQGVEMLLSQKLMAATTLTNVVYPLRTQGRYLRHYSPGKIWDCLYTWDAGFIGLGLLEIDVDAAICELNAYTTPAGSQSAFIHHGTPLPTQIYLLVEIWNRTQSRPLLAYFYPRLRQYYLFLAGRLGSSTTRKHQDQLICTWDYFYNSGGWDDYPPQLFARKAGLTSAVAPAVSSSHVIRAAKLLSQVAEELGIEADLADYAADARQLSSSLQHYSWDSDSGYFGYVLHDKAGAPSGILRTESGVNFNMGLDGVAPLIAGICNPSQRDAILHNLFSAEHLWTSVGITTVDKQAPYYNSKGYWNGSVWFAHQWFLFKTMLDVGRGELACRIAQTGLDIWKKSTDSSLDCMEHFSPEPPYGAGWCRFSSLSSPALSWFAAMYTPGRLTTGFDCWTSEARFTSNNTRLRAVLEAAQSSQDEVAEVLVAMGAGRSYEVCVNGTVQETVEVHPGLLRVKLKPNSRDVSYLLTIAPTPRSKAS